MGTKFAGTAVAGYNSSPPPDDGTTVAANKISWSTIKSKITDPLNTFASAISSALVTALDFSSSTTSVNYTTQASDHEKPIECTNSITISLGDASTMGIGYRPIIANVGSGTVTVGLATAGNTLNQVANGTLSLPAGCAAIFNTNAAATGYECIGYYSPSTDAGKAGDGSNIKMSATAANASQTFTADEVIVETALGGLSKKLSSYSQTCNLGTTGAGGMDTGTAPVSGFVSVYAIAKADGTKSVLACAVATSTGRIYGGANMPAGYTYSGLIAICPTDGSSRFKPGILLDRAWMYQSYVSIAGGLTGSTLTSQSISSGVPAAARSADITIGNTGGSGNYTYAVAGDSTGTGGSIFIVTSSSSSGAPAGGTSSLFVGYTAKDVPLITSQTIYWAETIGHSGTSIYVSGYKF